MAPPAVQAIRTTAVPTNRRNGTTTVRIAEIAGIRSSAPIVRRPRDPTLHPLHRGLIPRQVAAIQPPHAPIPRRAAAIQPRHAPIPHRATVEEGAAAAATEEGEVATVLEEAEA